AALALAAAVCWPAPAAAQVLYTIQDLGTLPGGTDSQGLGINASGQVAGFCSPAGGGLHAVRTTAAGRISDPGADLGALPGGTYAKGFSINDSGRVAGSSNLPSNSDTFHAFRTTAAGVAGDPGADLGTLGGTNSQGYAINAAGQV